MSNKELAILARKTLHYTVDIDNPVFCSPPSLDQPVFYPSFTHPPPEKSHPDMSSLLEKSQHDYSQAFYTINAFQEWIYN